jgi:hypothetical protein
MELVARYRDAPTRALFTLPALLYVLLNSAASAAALFAIAVFDWTFGVDAANTQAVTWTQLLVAGFGSMVLFRSALFVVRVGENDFQMGPGAVLQVFLQAADRAVDRTRAEPRAATVARIMKEVSFDKAKAALPAYCFALMQNVSAEEQSQFGRLVNGLQAAEMDSSIKSLNLGLALMNLVGEPVLEAAVKTLGPKITGS